MPLNLAQAIDGLIAGKTVICSDSYKSTYRLMGGRLSYTNRHRGADDFTIYGACGDGLIKASHFADDTVTVPKSELTALRQRLDELEKGSK